VNLTAETGKQISEAILVTSARQYIQENQIEGYKQRLDEREQFCYRTERNLAEITDKLNGLIAQVDEFTGKRNAPRRWVVRDRKRNRQP
jgi:chromosome segregation ATPase